MTVKICSSILGHRFGKEVVGSASRGSLQSPIRMLLCLLRFRNGEGPDNVYGLYSRDNRRLVALMAFQATRRDVLIQVRCIVRDCNDSYYGRRWRDAYSGAAGLSISPRDGIRAQAQHGAVDLYSSGPRAMCALRRLRDRVAHRRNCRSLDEVLRRLRTRSSSRAQSERTLAFASPSVVRLPMRSGARDRSRSSRRGGRIGST